MSKSNETVRQSIKDLAPLASETLGRSRATGLWVLKPVVRPKVKMQERIAAAVHGHAMNLGAK